MFEWLLLTIYELKQLTNICDSLLREIQYEVGDLSQALVKQLHFRLWMYDFKMKVLIIEDERDLAEAVKAVLQKNNYTVEVANDGEYGLDCALTGLYNIVILDVMLPRMDGIHVVKELRSAGVATPVLMLTARGDIRDKVIGLDGGADDYLPKPFNMEELLARLRALSRRNPQLNVGGVYKLGELEFNPHTLMLTGGSANTELTLKESQLLELLLERKNSYVSKDIIIEKLWSYDSDVQDSLVESQVSLLRKKLAAAGGGVTIRTARGVGYRVESEQFVL